MSNIPPGQPTPGPLASSRSPQPTTGTIDLTDFTPGIHSRLSTVIRQFPTPDGSAQAAGTWGCYALQDGGLGPLPRVAFYRTAGDPNIPSEFDIFSWPTVANDYPAEYDRRIAVLDSVVISPVERVPPLSGAVDYSTPSVDLFTCRQWFMVDGTAATGLQPLVIHRFRGHPVYSGDTANTYAFRDIYSTDLGDYGFIDPSRFRYGWGSIMSTRTMCANDDDDTFPTTNIGPPVLVAGLGAILRIAPTPFTDTSIEGLDSGQYLSYPDYHTGDDTDPLDPTPVLHDAVYTIPQALGVATPGIMFGHQGRMCAIQRKSGYKVRRRYAYHGNHDGFLPTSELLAYWPVNGIYNAPNGPTIATFLEESSTGYGVAHSVNANSLLLIKNVGGAVHITGDLDRPQVQRLPGIPGVGGLANRPAVTEQGIVYGSTSGVWLWAGSDSAQPLSPQLDPLSWLPDDPTTARRELDQLRGSFAYRWPYVYAPNNWLLDMRTSAWFRYYPTPEQQPPPDPLDDDARDWQPGDGATFAFNDIAADGNSWATVASYLLNGIFFAEFDQTTGTSSYQWQSQPLNKTRSRFLEFRDITLVASGLGRVVVTVTGFGAAPQSATFDIQGNGIDIQTSPLGIVTSDVTVTIAAQSFDPELPAPTIHRVSLTHQERQLVPETGVK